MNPISTVLVVGATGSIGRHVVAESLAAGYATRALVRDPARASLPAGVEVVVGDVTRPETLAAAVTGVDAIVFTLGSDGQGSRGAETIDYGGVRNVLEALGDARPRIALMTSIGVTNRTGSYNRSTQSADWKRRSERLVRASGLPYTIVRPGWFDYHSPDQQRIVLLQGDTRHTGSPADGVIARRQIARVLVTSLASPVAEHTTFELVAEAGGEQVDLEPVFAALDADPAGSLDGVRDTANQPLEDEPVRVRQDLAPVVTRRDLLTRGVLLGAAGLSLAGCTPAATTAGVEPSGSPTSAARPQPSGSPTATSASRTLVAVFSRAGENHYYGGRTWLEVGNTEVVVGLLAALVEVDVYRIVPAEPYPTDYEETVAQNVREQDAEARPRIAGALPDLAGYDKVVLASGIWNVQPPMIMRTFAEAVDLTGRTVHPLTTHAGSGLGRAAEVYRQACRGATLGAGLAVRGEEAADAGPDVRAWLQRVGLLG